MKGGFGNESKQVNRERNPLSLWGRVRERALAGKPKMPLLLRHPLPALSQREREK
jgi:hypothetical protein